MLGRGYVGHYRCKLVTHEEMVNREGGVVLAQSAILGNERGYQVSVGNAGVTDSQ